jgi:hypothetical protein
MTNLTAELRHEIEMAGDEPVRIEDPETQTTYVLIKADFYDQTKPSPAYENLLTDQIPEGIRLSRDAFLGDLPELLARKRLRGRWVLYHGNKRIGIWRNPRRMDRDIMKLGLRIDEYYAGLIEPHPQDDDEIESSLFEYEEIEPSS